MGWGGSYRGRVGHVGVGWVIQGWTGVGHAGMGWIIQEWGGVGHQGLH